MGNTFKLIEEQFVVWSVTDIVDVDVPDDTFFVDDENRAFRIPLTPQYPVEVRHSPKRRKVTKQWKLYAPETFGPCFETRDVIDTDTQNLGV